MKELNVKERDLKEALDPSLLMKEGYTDAWIQALDSVTIGPLSEAVLNEDTLIEARIIGPDKEIHIFGYQNEKADEVLRAVETIREEDDICIDSGKQILRKKYGDYVIMRQFLAEDEDHQMYVARTVLAGYGKGGR